MHNAVVGMSGCGKSRMMKEIIIPAWRQRGVPVMVLDPMCAQWPADWITDDPYKFLSAAQSSRRCVLVVDECDEMLRASAQRERDLKYLATRSRNDGHLAYFLAQRTMQIPPSYRNQCSTFYAFLQVPEDAEEIYNLTGQRAAFDAPRLPLGACIVCKPGVEPVRIRVF